jgi:serine/threonine protein kinase
MDPNRDTSAPTVGIVASTGFDICTDDALSNELSVDTIINEQYKVLSKLGSGGMSHVYRCEDMQLNRLVAIKLLRVDLSADSPGGRRFQREAQIVAMLEQDNIVKLYGLHLTENRQPFIVMELVDGVSLDDLIEKSGRLPLPRVIKFIAQICDALSVAHAHGVIHRDLKPSNIMVVNAGRSDEKIKLLDFGIAKIANSHELKTTRTGEVFGSPVYMSPEQAQGRIVDEKTDQYSLGCLIFELLTGRPPFVCENFLNMMLAHVQEPAPTLSKVGNRKFPLQMEAAVAKLLEKDRGHRFASIEDVKFAFVGKTADRRADKKHWRFAVPVRAAITVTAVTMLCLGGALFHWPAVSNNALNESAQSEKIQMPEGLSADEIALFRRLHEESMPRSLDLRNKKITDVGMKAFSGFRLVDKVSLVGCYQVTDIGLKYLVGLPLRSLYLSGTQLSDAGLQAVCSISTVESLDLSDTDITNDGCSSLTRLPRLRELHLSRTSITGPALSKIAKLTKLEELFLNGDDVRDNLSALQSLQLRDLQLNEAGLRDSDMQALSKMQSLLQIGLDENKGITDAGLIKLATLPNLRGLSVAGCSVTARGLQNFKALSPACIVGTHHDGAANRIRSLQSSMQ